MKSLHQLQVISACLIFGGGIWVSPLLALDTEGATSKASPAKEIAELRAQLAKLEAASGSTDHRSHKGHDGTVSPDKKGMEGMKMGMKGKEMGMGGMKGKEMGMSKMKKGMGMMQMKGKGMAMMGRMPDASMKVSALPGFPGASHLYHIGSTGFFLDHQEHISLTVEQQENLNKIKETSIMEQNEFDRQIEKAEEELWKATSAGEPDAGAIEKKLTEIGAMTTKKRLSFIRAVGKAAKVLSEDQRKALTGQTSKVE